MKVRAEKIINQIKFIINRIVSPVILNVLFAILPRRSKTLLIIKNDGIGDYVLFRNYFKFLKESERFKDYQIYLLGNLNFKELALSLDADVVSGFYWYNDGYFLRWSMVKLLLSIHLLRPEIVFYPNYSRKFVVDWIVKNISAKKKIGVNGDTINESYAQRKKTGAFYDELIECDSKPLHEFDRNKQIVQLITGEVCQLQSPFINKNNKADKNSSIVIFPGGSDPSRRWSAENFNELCAYLISEQNVKIILAGGKDDIYSSHIIAKGLSQAKMTNQTGSISLTSLCNLIGNAKLLISNDTVAIHIAVAMDTPVVCIAKGDLYGRFLPYPKHIFAKMCVIFPLTLQTVNCYYDQWSSININEISPSEVCLTVKRVLDDINKSN